MTAVKLTPNFTLAEFEFSETAIRKRIRNTVPNELLPNARRTCEMLQRIRDFLSAYIGREIPITITSGYRCLALNREIGSDDNSAHVQALAVDWIARSAGTPTQICHLLASRTDELGIGQLINEYPDGSGWVHTGVNTPRKEIDRILTYTHAGVAVGIMGA